ncbi:MAG: ACT domain-containing protein, partial [Acidobacteria bacterium]
SGQLRREGNRLTLDESAPLFRREPQELLNVFSRAQLEDLELSDELKQAIRANLSLVTRSFRAAPESGRLFLDILGRRGRVGRALRLMHETGFLGRYLPEFARITFLVQHDFYHRYTIDEHTLRAIEALDEVAHRRESRLIPFQKIFAEVRDPAVLYLGLLLHDIGKGRSGSHVPRSARLAERVCERLGLESSRTAQVVFLVRHHLLMSHLSQRRDLTEDALIEDFVRQVETLDHLNMLLLLTYADTFAVGPGVWNEWKEALLWELYARARARLTGGRPMRGRHAHRAVLKEQINRALPIKFLPSEIERHLAMMPDRYLRATRPQGIARHLLLVKRLDAQPLAIDWRTHERESCTELTLCTRDRVGLFALIAGTLTAQGLNILSADLYTREDDIVIDTFKVCEVSGHRPVRPEWQSKVERHLRDAMIGRFDVAAAVQIWRAKVAHRRRGHAAHRPAPIVVRFDSTASATSTVIEVKAEDEPGLAYTIASTLTALGLNITFAKVATEKNLAVDVFYVTDARGEKLTADIMAEVERALLEALDGEVKNRIDEEA